MLKMIERRDGFTLVELMVVVVIIGVLVAIAIPLYGGIVGRANRNAVESNLRIIDGAISMHLTEKGSYPGGMDDLTDDFLAEEPTGPDGVTYDINTENKAEASQGTADLDWWTATENEVSLPVEW